MTPDQSLKIISKAWGRQQGYCFFPVIPGDAVDKKARILGFNEGNAFFWPKDRDKILEHLHSHTNDDLYWCPSLFEEPIRRIEFAMDEHALWADLDEVHPETIEDYPPSIAWETSPGRYQALWLIVGGDMQGASWAGRENQRLTYHIGADKSGWDTTQLLRLPGWKNHKPEYRRNGKPRQGKLLWADGRKYLPDEWQDLPEIDTATAFVGDILEDEIGTIDRHEVWGRVRLKVSKTIREYLSAREPSGDRSEVLWQIERELADAGCSVTEIICIVRASVWNKYTGRSDELRRLATEASRAIAARPAKISEKLLEERETKPKPTNLFVLVQNLKPPAWLIRDVLTVGAVGFIAGQPKSFKSWAALDMALSVASGQPYLNHFTVMQPGPTLYIQEEDSGPLIKSRLGKIWPDKMGDKITLSDGEILWTPGEELTGYPDIDAYVSQTLTISDPSWQAWLDETLTEKAEAGMPYQLVVMDPLMMMAGEVEENRAQEMTTKIFRPLKDLARKHGCAIQLVHHMRKGDGKNATRGGQMLLGSVANHAWAEDSQYFTRGARGVIVCEQESKNAPVPGFRISGIAGKRTWSPTIQVNSSDEDETPKPKARKTAEVPKAGAIMALRNQPTPLSVRQISQTAGITIATVYSTLRRYEEKGWVLKTGTKYGLTQQGIEATSK